MRRSPQVALILSAALLLGAENGNKPPPKPDHPAAVEALKRAHRWMRFDEDGNIKQLRLPFRPELLVHLKGLHHLEYLRYPHGATDADMAYLQGLRTLRDLRLNDADISDDGMAHLSTLTELRRLSFPIRYRKSKITDRGLVHLKNLKKLETLSLGGTNVGDAGLIHLSGLSNLRDLALNGTNVTDAGLVHLRTLTKLRRLGLQGAAVTVHGVEPLEEALPYTIIRYHGPRRPRPDDADAVAALKRAGAELKLSDRGSVRAVFFTASQHDADLVYLRSLPYLEWLRLGAAVRMSDGGLAELRSLRKLVRLDLSAPQVTDGGVAHLAGLLRLRSLKLALPKLTDAGLVHLKGLANLEELDLSNTNVTDAALANLKGLSYLRELDLTGTSVTDAGLEHLRGLNGLGRLHLAGTKVTEEGIARLKEARPRARIEYLPHPPEERR